MAELDLPMLGDELTWEPMRIMPPGPWAGHIPFAFWLAGALRPDSFVELGTHSGNSYFAFCQALAARVPGARAYAVDTWQGDEHAGHYGEEVFASVAAFNAEHFARFSTLMRMTFDDARSYFPPGQIDLLHIDGLHSYEAVRHDFEVWQDALSPRAVVVFHDTNVRDREFGVWRFWHELRANHPSFEFNHSNGLGVVGVGPEQVAALQALFALPPDAAAAFRSRLAARGQAFQWQAEVQSLRALLDETHAIARRDIEGLQGRLAALEGPGNPTQQAMAALERSQSELAWRDHAVAQARELAQAKDMHAATLAEMAAGRLATIAVRDAIIVERDAALAARDKQLAASAREIAGHDTRLAELGIALEGTRAKLAAAEAQLAGDESSPAEQARLAAVHAAYVGSTSWRLTRPMRVASRLLRGQGMVPPPLTLSRPPPAPPALAAPADAPPDDADVTAVTPRKQAVRDMFAAQLQAFLTSGVALTLPSAAEPDVSIVLVLFNQAELTYACLASIAATLGQASFGVEVVIADNASSDDTAALLEHVQGATILRMQTNLHFLRAANAAARQARGRTLLLLNNDAQLLPGSLAAALRTLDADPTIGAVGARIILPDGTLQEAGSIIWRDGACSGFARGEDPAGADVMYQRDVDYCSGAFLLTPAETWRKLGGFDERFAPAYYEETDYCVRLWESGRRVVYDPEAVILHYEFGSSTQSGEALRLQAANHAVFTAQHAAWLADQWPASPLNALTASTARSARPRILVLEDRVPRQELGAGYPRANRLLHELVAAGADVTFFPMYRHHETWPAVHHALDKRINVLYRAEASQLRAYLVARHRYFDAVLVCRPQNMRALLDAIGPERDLLGGATLLYDAEALFAGREIQRRTAEGETFTAEERSRAIAEEVSLTRLSAAVISVSHAEQQTLEDFGAKQVHLLGHALDEEPLPSGYEQRDQVVFLGAMGDDNAPNADSVRWFSSAILPGLREALAMPVLRLTVIGRNGAPSITALDGQTLDLVGMVEDLPPALMRARLMVVPTRYAAGIPHKVHQAAALGIPMVVTPIIAKQLGWQDGDEVLVADEPDAFAAACARLYRDQALWTRIRDNALQRVRLDCDPAAFTAKVREIVAALPIVRRQPEGAAPLVRPQPPAPPAEPPTSRPAESDWALATPFGFPPLEAPAPRIAVICHLFHTVVARELLFYLRNLPGEADLFVSTDTEAKRASLAQQLQAWDRGALQLRVTPNRGRDIAPKLVGFRDAHEGYDLVLHLHSKMSTHAAFLQPWRSYLFETLLGTPEVVRSNLDAFARLPDLGLLAAQHYEGIRRWLGWNGNYPEARALAGRMGLVLSPARALDFPSGSMFWARPAALRPLLDLRLAFEDFPQEGAQVDHTPAHAIERLFFYACEKSGHTWLKVARPALMIDTRAVMQADAPAALSRFVAEHGVLLSGPGSLRVAPEPAPMMTRIAPGLASRLASRAL